MLLVELLPLVGIGRANNHTMHSQRRVRSSIVDRVMMSLQGVSCASLAEMRCCLRCRASGKGEGASAISAKKKSASGVN